MSSDGSRARETDLGLRQKLLQCASEGKLDGLPCPRCRQATVSVWFTRRSDNDYWTWFVCENCDFEMRAQGARPAHYSEERERAVPRSPRKRGIVST
jgi:hypothetical protein